MYTLTYLRTHAYTVGQRNGGMGAEGWWVVVEAVVLDGGRGGAHQGSQLHTPQRCLGLSASFLYFCIYISSSGLYAVCVRCQADRERERVARGGAHGVEEECISATGGMQEEEEGACGWWG